MSENSALRSLIVDVAAARYFDDAAGAALRAILATVTDTLSSVPAQTRGRVLRGVIHLRPGDGYRRLWAVEQEPTTSPPGADAASLHSATAWRWLREHGDPFLIDLVLGMVRPFAANRTANEGHTTTGNFQSIETRQRLLSRDATHLQVLPLRVPGGATDGMISVEARCPPPAVEALMSPQCCEQLTLLAQVASPYLTSLPLRSAAPALTDDLLPVVGATTAGIIEMLRIFSQQAETLLIGGPTGSGKSRLARWCHAQSRRREKPFEVLDLLSVPDELQMAELFGWKRGAFTGAVKDSPGAVSRAEGGTLFLDEIDKLSLKAQAGLLRVLEARAFRPVGDSGGDHRADVRFVVGTNADLFEAVNSGRFREDLYYRINVLPVKLPALSERLDELPLWASYMLERRSREETSQGEARFSPDAVKLLVGSPWPGNLRQLDNIVRRAYAIALLDTGTPSRDLLIQPAHVARALAYERGGDDAPLVTQLQKAAFAFVCEAERRQGSGLSLDLVDGFRGLVLGTAVLRAGDRDTALERLGQAGFVKSRNQQKIMRREIDRLRELARALGPEAEAAFDGIIRLGLSSTLR